MDKKKFKSYPIGYFPIVIAEVQNAEGELYPYVAINRTSKFAFLLRSERPAEHLHQLSSSP